MADGFFAQNRVKPLCFRAPPGCLPPRDVFEAELAGHLRFMRVDCDTLWPSGSPVVTWTWMPQDGAALKGEA